MWSPADLGPILFILYTADLVLLIERHGLSPHLYADDTQLYGSCRPDAVDELSAKVTNYVQDVVTWMKSNRLSLNTSKTEILWCATNRRQHQLPSTPLDVDGASVLPVKSVRDLGIYLDSDLGMKTHVRRLVSGCFSSLRQLQQIRRSVPPATLKTLVVALVLSRLDQGNSVLVGLPAYPVDRLQSVLNAAARLILRLRINDHITDAIAGLHWLRPTERVTFKIATLMFKVLHGMAPGYLGPFIKLRDLPGRQGLRSSDTQRLLVPPHKLTTVGSRAFPVAGARIWNALPDSVIELPTLLQFRRKLKRYLYTISYPDHCIF